MPSSNTKALLPKGGSVFASPPREATAGFGFGAGAIGGATAKSFHTLQINGPATISNTAGGTITIENNYTNTGTFSQAAAQTTIFATDNSADGAHALSGAGTTTSNVPRSGSGDARS